MTIPIRNWNWAGESKNSFQTRAAFTQRLKKSLIAGFLSTVFIAACAHRKSMVSSADTPSTQTEKQETKVVDDLNFVLYHSNDEFRKLPTQHYDALEKSQELARFFESLAALDKDQLTQIDNAYSQKDIRSPFLKQHWKLLLRNENSWRSYHNSALVSGASTYGVLSFLVPICPSLSASLQTELLSLTGASYAKLMKNRDPNAKKLSPKRYADGVIRCLLRPAEWLQKKLADGSNILSAYDDFRMLLKSQVFKQDNSYGWYGANDVLQVSQGIQNWLKSSLPGDLTAGGALILLGSFPNFKANETSSDLDIVSRGMPQLTTVQTSALRTYLKDAGLGKLALPVNVDNFPNDWHHSRINPFLIRITTTQLHLVAYPTLGITEGQVAPLIDEPLIQ